MPDPAETQAAFAELFTELALQHMYPDPIAQPATHSSPAAGDKMQATANMLDALAAFYAARRG